MKDNFYTQEDLIKNTNITAEQLTDWARHKLIRPAGFTADNEPIYAETSLEQIRKILALQELGYGTDDIQKIVRKIGLPRQQQTKNRKSTDQFLTVGHLAEQVDVSPRTIKHWENMGIIAPDMRTEGGFRLYSEQWIFFCQLIKDLQLFGYSLEQIKQIADYFREYNQLRANPEAASKTDIAEKIKTWTSEIDSLFTKLDAYRQALQRWDELLKKKRKDVNTLKAANQKRPDAPKGE